MFDQITGRIDTLVAKKRRLIALLGEKRTALISRTVTRGLPADAAREFGLEPHIRFKDSGIEWLGEVPEGWQTPPLYSRYSIELGKMLNESLSRENIWFAIYEMLMCNGIRLVTKIFRKWIFQKPSSADTPYKRVTYWCVKVAKLEELPLLEYCPRQLDFKKPFTGCEPASLLKILDICTTSSIGPRK